MFYTPKHCIECGDKIDRSEWKITTSRRFCENCEGEHKIADWLPRLFFGLSLLLALIGVGSAIKKGDQSANAPVTQIVSTAANKNQDSPLIAANQKMSPNRQAANDTETLKSEAPVSAAGQSSTALKTNLPEKSGQNQASEAVYYCGAQTKKGTPCSRHVKVKGQRCWQHRGLPAIVPPEQLVAER